MEREILRTHRWKEKDLFYFFPSVQEVIAHQMLLRSRHRLPACQICVNSKLKVAIRICDLAILMNISRTCRFVSHPIRSVIYKVCMYVYECFLVIMPNQLVDSAKEKFLMWYPPSSLEFGRLIQPITELMWYPVFCRGWERLQCPPVRRTFF